jgi:Cupin
MPTRYLPEFRERAVRMVLDHAEDYGSTTAACNAVSSQLGFRRPPLRLTDGSTHAGPARYVVDPGGACTTSTGEPLPEDVALSMRTCGDARDAPTAVLTGSYRVASRVAQRVLAALPPIVVIPDEGDLCPVMDLIMVEVERDLPGQQAVLDRLLDLLLISSLRTGFARQEAATPGWYAALTDPVLAPVLRLDGRVARRGGRVPLDPGAPLRRCRRRDAHGLPDRSAAVDRR